MAKNTTKGAKPASKSGAKKTAKPAPANVKKPAASAGKSKPAKAVKSAPVAKKGTKPAAKTAPKPAAKSKSAQAKPKASPSVKKTATKAAKKSAAAKPAATKPSAKAPAKAPAKPAAKAPAKPAPAPAPAPAPVKAAAPAAPAKAPAASSKSSSSKNGKTTRPVSVLPPPVATPLKVNKPVVDEVTIEVKSGPVKMTPFLKKQKQRLMELRSSLFESMEGMAQETIRSRPEGSDASVGGMHMGDAGSDAYDRDFALSLLSKEQDALYEINEALKRIDLGTYGICELSGKKINEERLEALPFTRYTREMQEQVERDQFGGKNRRVPVRSVFGLEGDDEDEDGDEDEAPTTSSQQSESSLDFMKE